MLLGSGSVSFPFTFAVLVSGPGVVAVTTIVMLALAPFARLPTPQVTVPPLGRGFVVVDRVQLPWVVATELKWTLLGKGSVTVTPVASCGPLFVTVSV